MMVSRRLDRRQHFLLCITPATLSKYIAALLAVVEAAAVRGYLKKKKNG